MDDVRSSRSSDRPSTPNGASTGRTPLGDDDTRVTLRRGPISFTHWMDALAPAPWPGLAGSSAPRAAVSQPKRVKLYTDEERRRRDATPWTLVQGVLAPIQFLVFLVSLGLIVRYLITGDGYDIAVLSVVIKTFVLYAIMITGCIWEKEVFNKWLFAHAFFWEDVFSMLVLALHTAYLVALAAGWDDKGGMIILALAAYATYVINAGQFLWKLRQARLEAKRDADRGRAVDRGGVAGSMAA